jgi:uncharacterized protein (UPF0276 family)
MNTKRLSLGLGIGWRPELALAIDKRANRAGLGFVEVIAEDFTATLPPAIQRLCDLGVAIIPHGISLSLGGAEPPDPARLAGLATLATRVNAPLVSEHLSFVRAGGLESGHLLPLPRTREALRVVVENLRLAKAALPVPLALENVATLFEWPHAEMDEAAFLTEVLEQADVLLLLDIENVYANCRNHGTDPVDLLERFPLERLAYVHIAGGIEREGIYHDTHAEPVPQGVLDLLEELSARAALPGFMLERDDQFPTEEELNAELDVIAAAVVRGDARREKCHVAV